MNVLIGPKANCLQMKLPLKIQTLWSLFSILVRGESTHSGRKGRTERNGMVLRGITIFFFEGKQGE